MNSRNQSYVIYLLLFIAIIVMAVYSFSQRSSTEDLTINQVAADIRAGKISEIEDNENQLRVKYYEDLREGVSNKENTATLVEQLIDLGVTPADLAPEKIKIMITPPSPWLGVLTALGYIFPFILLGGAFFFIFRQAQGNNNAAMSFGKSKARMFTGDQLLLLLMLQGLMNPGKS